MSVNIQYLFLGFDWLEHSSRVLIIQSKWEFTLFVVFGRSRLQPVH